MVYPNTLHNTADNPNGGGDVSSPMSLNGLRGDESARPSPPHDSTLNPVLLNLSSSLTAEGGLPTQTVGVTLVVLTVVCIFVVAMATNRRRQKSVGMRRNLTIKVGGQVSQFSSSALMKKLSSARYSPTDTLSENSPQTAQPSFSVSVGAAYVPERDTVESAFSTRSNVVGDDSKASGRAGLEGDARFRSPMSPRLRTSSFEDFSSFQRQYITAYLLCTFSDWLKGPYVYALYEEYGFSSRSIATLFIGGFLSSLIFGTVVGSLSDKYGRKRMCQVFCIVYALSAVTKLFNSFAVLFLGRILSGVATSLLYTSFESWMVSQHHIEKYDDSLLSSTFAKVTLGNAIVAVLAGLVAQCAVWFFGNVAPFLTAIPFLLTTLWIIRDWPENCGNPSGSAVDTLRHGYQVIRGSWKLIFLGSTQALFEGCMFLWVFVWTPSLESSGDGDVPFGLVFAAYMLGMMIGGSLSEMFPMERILIPMHATAAAAIAVAVLLFHHKQFVLWCFIIYECIVGMYYTYHGTLRSIHIEESARAAVMNIFRAPMNTLVFAVLQVDLSPRAILAILVLGNGLATFTLYVFKRSIHASS